MPKITSTTLILVSTLTLAVFTASAVNSDDVSSSVSMSPKVHSENQDLDITKINFNDEQEIVQLVNLAKNNVEKLLNKIKNDKVTLEEKNLFTDEKNFEYNSKSSDGMAALLNKYDGYNNLPKVISIKEFMKNLKTDEVYDFQYLENNLGIDGVTLYRGLNGGHKSGISVDKMLSDFKFGEFFNGYGATGNGSYFSPDMYIGARYAFPRWCTEKEYGKIMQIRLLEDTKIITYNNLLKVAEKYKIQNIEIENKILSGNYTVEDRIKRLNDVGHLAEILGYDAIAIEDEESHIWEFVLLNRSKAIVCEKDISYKDYSAKYE